MSEQRNQSLTPLQERRIATLRLVLAERFHGRQADMARAIGIADSFMWQLINRAKPVGEKLAARIEVALGMPEGGLALLPSAFAPLAEAAALLPEAAQDELHSFMESLTTKHAIQLGPRGTREVLNLLEQVSKRRSSS